MPKIVFRPSWPIPNAATICCPSKGVASINKVQSRSLSSRLSIMSFNFARLASMKCSLTALFSKPYASVNWRTACPYFLVLRPSINFSQTVSVREKLMLGLSTRKYGQAVRQFTEAYGLEKSAVSEHFIEASRAKLKDMMESRLDKLRLCTLLIDATPFEGQQMVAALGIGQDGRKTILGIRQGATENATVVGELLGDLAERGFDFTATRLYVHNRSLVTAASAHR